MSHHFDVDAARDDSRLNILDMYLFEGATPDTTAMIFTTNPDAGIFAPLTLHPEGVYAFRFDTNGDAREDIAFKFLFEEPHHVGGNDTEHAQRFRVLHAVGEEIPGHGGRLIAEGMVGEQTSTDEGVRAFVGRAAESWAADAFGFFTMVNGLFAERRYATEAFTNRNNLFATRNNMATVHRWGVPLFTHLFLSDPATPGLADLYHQTVPAQDGALFSGAVDKFITAFARIAGATADPESYARAMTARLIPAVLPYRVGSQARFILDEFNGRPLNVDAFDVMLSLGANTAITDGVAPDAARIRHEFPYCGLPYGDAEQAGLRPLRELIGLTY
jgi:hypothetical protein